MFAIIHQYNHAFFVMELNKLVEEMKCVEYFNKIILIINEKKKFN